MEYDFNTVVIGGGPAGSRCAYVLAKNGKKVAMVEMVAVGGVCLNRGCIPSKSYLYTVELLNYIKKAKLFGIEVGEPEINWEKVNAKKNRNVKMLGSGLTRKCENAGVEIMHAHAKIKDKNTVTVKFIETGEEKDLTCENIVIAIGSKPLFLPFTEQGEHVISSTEMLELEKIPETMVVIGGGVTGVETASIFSGLGTKVTIIERQSHILPWQDKEISERLRKALEKKGVNIYTNSEVSSAKDSGDKAEVVYKNEEGSEETLLVDKCLVVIGRQVNYDMDELAEIGIENNGKGVILDDRLKTTVPNIYMIGDSAWRNLTAYGAEREGEYVAECISRECKKPINYDHILTTVFSHPEVGQIGVTEEQAKEKGIDYEVYKSEFAANAKAMIAGERDGLVKIIVDKSNKTVLGVNIIGHHATDLVHQAIIAVVHELKVEEWLDIVWSHPVLSEVFKEALENDPA